MTASDTSKIALVLAVLEIQYHLITEWKNQEYKCIQH